jgi:hypothetical protein
LRLMAVLERVVTLLVNGVCIHVMPGWGHDCGRSPGYAEGRMGASSGAV